MKRLLPSIIILFTLAAHPCAPRASGVAAADLGSLSSTLERIEQGFTGIKEAYDGFQRFTSGVAAVWRALYAVIDPRALGLLTAVLIVSAGFSALGVPKGRLCFLVSLASVDALWLLWGRSMNPNSFAFLSGIIKANLYLLLPYFFIVISARFLPIIIRRAFQGFGGGLNREEARLLMERFEDESARARDAIARDIAGSEGNRVRLSSASRSRLTELSRVIKKIVP